MRGWHHGHLRAARSERAREILTELVPELLVTFGATPHPDAAFQRFDRFLAHLAAGVQLFSLFHANPGLLALIADVMAGAPRLAEHLAQRPALLEPVLAEGFFAPPPGRAALGVDLGRAIAAARDFEDALDVVRRWAAERRFQIGVQLLRRTLDATTAGPALADIAETALATLLPAVEAEFARRHGSIPGGALAIVGMGRLGSREMTLASDLDLILIYDAPAESDASNGPLPLPAATYYARLSQRLIAAITAPTAEGKLYEVDMRLRPSGASGPIASSLAGFARYQRESAWAWEHMALTRARPVAGDCALGERIAETVAAVLRLPRDPLHLVVEVAAMRRRIAAEHRNPPPYDLRNRRGGLIDLEFIVQYLMLRHAAAAPQILRRGTAAALAALAAAGLLPSSAAEELGRALALFRQVQMLTTLIGDGPPAAGIFSEADAATLARGAGAADFAGLDRDVTAAARCVFEWYERLVAEPARLAAPPDAR